MNLGQAIINLYAEAHSRSIDAFDDFIVEQLSSLIAFDSAVIAGVEFKSRSEYLVRSLHLHNQPLEKYADREYWESDQPDPMLMRAWKQPGRSVSSELKSMPEMTKAMLAYAKKYDIAQSLTVCSRPENNGSIDALALWRADGDPFSAADCSLMDSLLPHVFQAQLMNRQHQALRLRLGNAASTALIADMSGRIAFIDDAAVELMRSEWSAWKPPLLPMSLLECLAPDKGMLFKGRSLKIIATRLESFLCLKIQRLKAEDVLTGRELECLMLVRSGRTSSEIGDQLGISERTAIFHITNATHKLQAGSRRHAAEKASKLGLI